MGIFTKYPYTDFNNLNLDWIIQRVREVETELQEYLDNAVIKFADPITWDITEQYTTLTVVVDSDGTAYLSKQPVPAGIAIDNTNYWLPIFNYDDNINDLRSTIALNERMSPTSSQAISKNDLVYWKGDLYRALADISAGSAFIVGTNIELYTVDEKINQLATDTAQAVQDVQDNLDSAVNDIDDAMTQLALAIPAYNVLSLGLKNDGVTDNADVFQTILDTNTQKVYYFPAGTYLFSKTIIIPSNVHMFGDGVDSYIYGTTDGGVYGGTVLVAGNNVEIDHLRIGFNGDDALLIVGSNAGCSGITSHTYESAKSLATDNPLNIRENRSNVDIHDMYSTSTYFVQSEPSGTYKFTNISYRNLTVPNAMVSMDVSFGTIDGLIMDNIECDFVRMWATDDTHAANIILNNIKCCMLLAVCGHAEINNVSIICRSDSTVYRSAIYRDACRLIRGNYNVNNLLIDSGSLPDLDNGLLIYDSGYYNICNCISRNNVRANVNINQNNNVRLVNCDFRGSSNDVIYAFADNVATEAGTNLVLKNNGAVTYTTPNPYYTAGNVSCTAQGQSLSVCGNLTKSSAILDDDLIVRPLNFYKATADTFGVVFLEDASNNRAVTLCKVLKGSSDIRVINVNNVLAGGYSKAIVKMDYPYIFQS